ncbi:zinc-binding alcohol dehydrogenase family protein [Agrilactobacillus fermenti]|uniref:zinc-binding alcohol dehydrogenase family protein n=1 Tax=Agrilactobacillus fermenti TaxID=2586909 RepID=UPI001E4FCA9C|nr:zinc-binding alcohol dehydrogenase family protein [Agrilactobacillus fermenti]MCD2255589.1 zinc-binding alcohol dehydrogenase family protein [Agrilactobacillus fermenti]
MKAIGFIEHLPIEDPKSLQSFEVATPKILPHDLLVAVKGVSVNPVDVGVRRGGHGTLKQPKIIGWDAIGTVKALGSAVQNFQVGDTVYYAGSFKRQGSDAQYQAVDSRLVGHAPKQLTAAEAVTMPLTSLTAWEALFEKLNIDLKAKTENQQHIILIINGSGGVGSVAIQLAKLAGLKVIATASRPEAIKWVKTLGADRVIDHHADLVAQVHKLGIQYVDYILGLAKLEAHWQEIATLIKPDGQIASITENRKLIDLQALTKKRATFAWEWMFSKSWFQTDNMATQGAILDHAAALLDTGKLKSTVTKTYTGLSAKNLRQATKAVESGHMTGKVVVTGDWVD